MTLTVLDNMEYGSDAAAQIAYASSGAVFSSDVKFISHFNGADNSTTIIDDSSNAYAVTPYGNAKIKTTQSKFGGSSVYFESAGDYLKTTTACALGSGDFTVDFWTYLISRDTIDPCLINNYSAFGAGSFAIFAGHYGSSTTKYQLACDGAFPAIQSTANIIYNEWAHIALVRSSGVITLYLNGAVQGSYTTSATLNGSGNCWVGTCGDYLENGYTHGYIDELEILVGTAKWTEAFTSPTVEYATTISLQRYSEPSIISEGSYSLKAVAAQTTSLNKTLTRTITSPINLTGYNYIIGKIRSTRTGSNIKLGFHDTTGITTEITPNITATDTWQNLQLDISSVPDANKDAIDQIILTVVNADYDNTFYLDMLWAFSGLTQPLFPEESQRIQYLPFKGINRFINYRMY